MYEFLQSCSWWQLYLIAVGLNYVGTLISNTIIWKNPFYDLKDPSFHFIIFSLILVPLFVLIIERDDTEGRVMVAMQAILLVPFLILVGNTPETAEERIARAEQEFQAEKEALVLALPLRMIRGADAVEHVHGLLITAHGDEEVPVLPHRLAVAI